MFLEILETMKTEQFLAPVIGGTALLLMVALIMIDRYRRPENYRRDQDQKKSKE